MSAAAAVELVAGVTRFGRLTYLGPAARRRDGHAMIRCRCDCGTARAFERSKVVHHHTKSCGCGVYDKHQAWSRAVFGARSVPRPKVP